MSSNDTTEAPEKADKTDIPPWMRIAVDATTAAALMSCSRSTFFQRVKDGIYPAAGRDNGWSVEKLRKLVPAAMPIAVPRKAFFPRRPRSVPLGLGVTHLYRHFDADGRLLYVGISLSAIARLGEHKESSHWFWQIARIEVTAYATRASAAKAERITIQRERPLHNIVHNGAARA